MLHIGADYYPEHWPQEMWPDDIAKMKAAGVTAVRIAEFSWGKLEPRDGQFDFAWLDEIVRLLGEAGLEIILGTPTNCAPVWLYRSHPDTLQVERDGRLTATGIRGHRCMESPRFRQYAARIITEMARHYGNDPHVIAWQLDNEPEANHCNCPACIAKFRAYLHEKYKTVDAMNAAWGSDVWSGQISDWDEVTTPLGAQYSPNWLNPGYMLDYERFAAQSTVGYLQFQRDILRQYVPQNIPITTNACFSAHTIDFSQTFRALDVVSYDNYPKPRLTEQIEDEEALWSTAPVLDLMRGVKRQNFWIMEQLSGPTGCWGPMSPTPRPGMIEGYGLQDIAHGADMVLQFRWRSAARGAEMFWHGLIDPSNVPGRRFAEFERLCARVRELGWLDGTTVQSNVAILYGDAQKKSFELQTQSPTFSYWNELSAWHEAFTSLGVGIDVLDETAPLDNYRVVVVPAHFVTNPITVQNLCAFVKSGGTALITCRSGVKNAANVCVEQPLPGAFAALCGVTVAEYDPIGEREVPVKMSGETLPAAVWCDLLQPTTAATLAYYTGEFYTGTPAVTQNPYGQGTAYYIGTCPRRALRRKLAKSALVRAKLQYCDLPRGVQHTVRSGPNSAARFVFNENEKAQTFVLDGEEMTLQPFEMRIDRLH